MTDAAGRFKLSGSVLGALLLLAVISATLVAVGRRDYPNLHLILGSDLCLLSGVLALFFRNLGVRSERPFPIWLAISFGIAFLAELIPVLVTIEWPGPFASIGQSVALLQPATWPIGGFIQAIGVGCSIWLLLSGRRRAPWLAPALMLLGAVLFEMSVALPRYTSPDALGITRLTLVLLPLFWAAIGAVCWRKRAVERMLPALALMAAVLVLAQVAMLYSRAPDDTAAIIAHLGQVAASLVLLLSVMEMDATDMLERGRAEQHLALRAQHAAIVESSDDAIMSKTLQGVITSWNHGAQELFGYSAAETIGQPMLMLFPEGRRQEEADILAKIARGESVDHFETVRIRKDGTRIDVSVTISPLKNARGEVIGASKIARDISERKRAEQKLLMQLARLELFSLITRAIGQRQDLASIFQVVVRSLETDLPIDFGCICLYESGAAMLTVASVGLGSEAVALEVGLPEQAHIAIGRNGLSRCVGGQLVYEPDNEQVKFAFPQQLARAGLRSFVAAPLLVESKVFGVLIAARRTPHGFSSGECEFLRQLSEHVALAANQAETHVALQRAYDDLRQTQQAILQQERLRALGQMASGIAHDINNAMSPVALYTDVMLERDLNLSAQSRGYLQIIQQAVGDVAQTVARMREFYRQREPQLVLAPVQINPLVEQVIDLTRARWSDIPLKAGVVIHMERELGPELPPFMGVESEIREALTNLIFNAVDALPEGGRIALRTGIAAEDASIFVDVCDGGMGMDEDTRRRCLEPFFTTKGERGTGLGLAMVYGMVQRHSADIDIQSAVGQGTTIRLSFPRQTESVSPAGESAAFAPLARLRMLVVDDDPLLLKSLRDILEGDGHDVTAASGGQEGIDCFRAALQRNAAFEVVFTDLGMPYVDGRKVAGAIKSLSPSTPVILLTGWGQRMLDEGTQPAHVDRVLSKPPRLSHLREALHFVRRPKDP